MHLSHRLQLPGCGAKGLLKRLGLSLDGHEELPLKVPFILILVHAIFCEFQVRGYPGDTVTIQKLVDTFAKVVEAPKAISKEVLKRIGQEVKRYFERLASETPSQAGLAAFRKPDWVYVDSLINAEYIRARRLPFSEANRIKSMPECQNCDVIIDEFDIRILIRPDQNGKKLLRHTAAMFWLVLTHIGRHKRPS